MRDGGWNDTRATNAMGLTRDQRLSTRVPSNRRVHERVHERGRGRGEMRPTRYRRKLEPYASETELDKAESLSDIYNPMVLLCTVEFEDSGI